MPSLFLKEDFQAEGNADLPGLSEETGHASRSFAYDLPFGQ